RMARKKARDSDSVSDPSEGEFDSDDSMRASRPPKKKTAKKDHSKPKVAPRKTSPKKKRQMEEEESTVKQMDEDEDDEQRGLVEDYDEEDLLNMKVPDAPIPCMAADGGDRLIITDIIVENFKSYHGTRRIGPFHHSFTSIIGPNGSGKSNVIDSMLFVFGYKASKIRSKKVSVLIHSSAGKDNIPSCTVKISFQKIIDKPDGSYDVVEGSAFNVSRTAYRNNCSEYRMDGIRTSFKEVATRLKKVGIDLVHNRFLILQGEVEQIALMKPKSVNGSEDGMLEYLEDIIGSSRYKVPIEKLTNKMEKLQTERSHQISKVNTANLDKEALDEPVQTTLTYLTMENQAASFHCQQHLLKKYYAEDSANALEPEQAKIEQELTKVTNDLKEVADKLKEKKAAIDSMTKKLALVNADIHKTTNELECLVEKDKKRQNDLTRLNNEMKRLQAEVKREKEKMEEVMRAPVEAKAKIEQLNKQLNEYRDELTTAQEKFDENFPKYNKKTEEDRARKAKLEEEYSGIAARLADAQSKCKLAESSVRTLMEEYEKKKTQLEELERSLKTNQEKLDKDKAARVELQGVIARQKDQRDTARGEINSLGEREGQIKKRLHELAPMFDEKQQEANARRNVSKTTQAFEDAVRKGSMRGYLGRVGDLGSIDPKYDRAVSNNFSGNLDMYLVEDGRTASEGAALLKKMQMRSNFLSLDRQQRFWAQIKKIEDENGKQGFPALRLFNLIKCDHKFKPAIYFAVRGAYVVDNLDQALALHKKLASQGAVEIVATIDGSMVNSRGAIVGGGQIREGKMGTAKTMRRESSMRDDEATAARVKEAEREKGELERELQAIVQRRRELEFSVNQCTHPLNNKEVALRDLDRQIKMMEERVRVQEQQRGDRALEMEKVKVDEEELARRQSEIDQLVNDRDQVTDDSKTFKVKIKEIDNDMAKVYNKLVKPHESTLASAREQIEKAEKDVGKQYAIINSAERNIAKQQSRVNDIEKDLDKKRDKSNGLLSEEETYGKNKIQKQGLLDESKKLRDDLEEKLKGIRQNTTELDTEEVALEKQLKMMHEALKEIKAQTAFCVRTINDCDKKISELTLHNITEILSDIPEDIRNALTARRFSLDGESDSDLEDFEELMSDSPKKEKKKSRDESPRKKKARMDEDDGEEEEEDEDNTEREEDEQEMEGEAAEEDETTAGPSTDGADAPMEEDGQPEHDVETTDKSLSTREKKRIREEALRSGQMPEWSRRYILRLEEETIKTSLETLDKRLSSIKKQLQPHVLEDYKKKVDKYRKESELLSAIKEKYLAHRDKLEGLKKLRLADFMGGFESISTALRELYQMITLGGDASLELKDVIDPFIEGVQFMVRPPKKSWKQIENLSGGEKTLSSLALVFALHKYRPTPLYVMDEIDAALDFRNVSIIGHYIQDRTKNAQFIIISLRNNMFELADRLIGIYKVQDCTRNVVVDPKRVLAETEAARNGLNKVRMLMDSNKIQTGVGQ
ncbi:hypothetical protein PMAYCL1PPCAC_00113, partial [Pristionchus mayeri]